MRFRRRRGSSGGGACRARRSPFPARRLEGGVALLAGREGAEASPSGGQAQPTRGKGLTRGGEAGEAPTSFFPAPPGEGGGRQSRITAIMAQGHLKLFIWTGLLSSLIVCVLAQQGGNNCIKHNAKSCADCIQAGSNCGWCKNVTFLKEGESTSARCDDLEVLKSKGCPADEIENPRGSQQMLKNKEVTNRIKGQTGPENLRPEDITQIQPQQVHLKLRIGEPQTFSLKFKRAEDYPIDLYYLMDLSYSMKDDLENVKSLGTSLMSKMKDITSDFRIGFGSFVEKTVMPYISTTPAKLKNPCTGDLNCTSPFSYRNVLNFTKDGSLFNKLVGEQQISGNLDSPEGGFDAIMQVAVCGVSAFQFLLDVAVKISCMYLDVVVVQSQWSCNVSCCHSDPLVNSLGCKHGKKDSVHFYLSCYKPSQNTKNKLQLGS